MKGINYEKSNNGKSLLARIFQLRDQAFTGENTTGFVRKYEENLVESVGLFTPQEVRNSRDLLRTYREQVVNVYNFAILQIKYGVDI